MFRALLIVLTVLSTYFGICQNQMVILNSETKVPVSFAAVWIKHTNQGTHASENGNAVLSVQPGDTVCFSSVGYLYREVIYEDIEETILLEEVEVMLEQLVMDSKKLEHSKSFGPKKASANIFETHYYSITEWMLPNFLTEIEVKPELNAVLSSINFRVKDKKPQAREHMVEVMLYDQSDEPLLSKGIYRTYSNSGVVLVDVIEENVNLKDVEILKIELSFLGTYMGPNEALTSGLVGLRRTGGKPKYKQFFRGSKSDEWESEFDENGKPYSNICIWIEVLY